MAKPSTKNNNSSATSIPTSRTARSRFPASSSTARRSSILAKNKYAGTKRGFRARRQQTDAGLATRLTTMENKA